MEKFKFKCYFYVKTTLGLLISCNIAGGSGRGVSRDLIFWLLQVEENLKREKETQRDIKRLEREKET
jgi:hypothetical protein